MIIQVCLTGSGRMHRDELSAMENLSNEMRRSGLDVCLTVSDVPKARPAGWCWDQPDSAKG